MIGILRPIFFVGSAINAACTAYCVGQIALAAYKKVRALHGEKIRASELRESFIQEFKKETGIEPDEAVIRAALKSYNVVEHPVRQWVDDTVESWSSALEKCVQGQWLEDIVCPKDDEEEVTDLGSKDKQHENN